MRNKYVFVTAVVLLIAILVVALSALKKNTSSTQSSKKSFLTKLIKTNDDPVNNVDIMPLTKQIPLDVSVPINGTTVNTPSVSVKGTTVPNADVFINEIEMKANNQGQFSTTYKLYEGENYLYISVNDQDGNYSEKDLIVNYIP